MDNFVKPGARITVTAAADYDSGDMFLVGTSCVGICVTDIANGDQGEIALEGVYTLPKTAGVEALSVGTLVYSDGSVVSSDDSGVPCGFVETAALIGAASVRVKLGVISTTTPVYRSFTATFDATGGAAIGTHAFGAVGLIPDNAYILHAMYEVETTFTSATDAGTIALGVVSDDAAGLQAAIAISNGGNPYDAGLHDTLADWTAANATTKTTAARQLLATVAVEDLTAGILTVKGVYVVGA